MSETLRTLEQERARNAWENIEAVVKQPDYRGDYKSLVKRVPALILTNGLLQTLAFLESKPKKPHFKILAQQLSKWVCRQLNLSQGNLSERLREGDSALLRLATQESLAYLQWLRRFAEAEISEEGKED
jgi:CRISPR-associated protein Cmr5